MGRALKLFVAVAVALVVLVAVLAVLGRGGGGGGGGDGAAEAYSAPAATGGWSQREVYPILDTLNYTLVGAREHASWIWSSLGEYGQDDPAVAPYLEWLRRVLSEPFQEKPFRLGSYVVLDADSVGSPRLPANGSKVRMGYVRLPFGYGLVVTAYQDEEGLLNVVVHATVLNGSDFRALAARVIGYAEIAGLQMEVAPGVVETCDKVVLAPGSLCFDKPTTYWYLWRVPLFGAGYLLVPELRLLIRVEQVYVLLEMPNIGAEVPFELSRRVKSIGRIEVAGELWERVNMTRLYDSRPLEHANWVMFHAAFGLASNFASVDPGNVALWIAFTGTRYNWMDSETPLEVRMAGGYVCRGTATATAILVSSLGAPSLYPSVQGRQPHAVGAIARLSSMGERGRVWMGTRRGTLGEGADLDFDGEPDSFDVLIDTAELSADYIEGNLAVVRTICPPLVCMVIDPAERSLVENLALHLLLLYTGAPQAVLGLPDWLKTPALLEYQWLTERWIERLLTNYTYYDALVKAAVSPSPHLLAVGYTGVVEGQMAERVALWLELNNRRIDIAYSLLVADVAGLRMMEERGVGPEFFVPPSVGALAGALRAAPLIYSNTTMPPVPREYAFRYGERVVDEIRARERLRQRPQEPPKPVEVEAVLEPVYVEVPFYLSETESIVARAFDRWEGRVAVGGNEYTVRLYRFQRRDRPGEHVYVLEFEKVEDWWRTRLWLSYSYYPELPANGSRMKLYLDGRDVALTLYYRPAELPDVGLIEVAEDALTLYQEHEYAEDGEPTRGRVYVINATTVFDSPALVATRGGAVVVVQGSVGTLAAGVYVRVYGAPTRVLYTATAELVLPNGTAVPLRVEWWTPNPPETGVISISTNTYGLPPTRLDGSTLRIAIPELNLTVVIRVPG